MLLKLLLPPYNRMVTGGSVVKWHKAEGERVAFGEDLFDLKVEAVQINPLLPVDVPEQIELLVNAQVAVRQLSDEELMSAAPGPDADSSPWVFGMRITSSDRGILRKIYAGQGDLRQIGDLLAVLSTEENEALPGADQPLSRAGVFRVIANLI
jgi:hypothetical protein